MSKNIDEMNVLEICEYLNKGLHNLPLIIKHSKGYAFFSKEKNLYNLKLNEAYDEIKKLDEEENKMANKKEKNFIEKALNKTKDKISNKIKEVEEKKEWEKQIKKEAKEEVKEELKEIYKKQIKQKEINKLTGKSKKEKLDKFKNAFSMGGEKKDIGSMMGFGGSKTEKGDNIGRLGDVDVGAMMGFGKKSDKKSDKKKKKQKEKEGDYISERIKRLLN